MGAGEKVWGCHPNLVCICVSVLGGDSAVSGFAGAPGLQFRGAPQLLHYVLGALREDEDQRGELTLVHRAGECMFSFVN